MSLMRAIIRSCVVAALRDQTWAADRVYDSRFTPIAQALYETGPDGKPINKFYLVVYTDRDDLPTISGMAELYRGLNRRLQVTLELGAATAITDPKNNLRVVFSHSDEGLEWSMDVLQAQCVAALFGNPYSPWGELFKTFIRNKVYSQASRHGGMAGQGVRFAARRVTYTVGMIDDLQPGVVPKGPNGLAHPIANYMAMAQDPKYAALHMTDKANVIQQFIATTDNPSWRQAQTFLGVTGQTAANLVVPGAPLPWPGIELPLDDGTYPPADTNEYPPAMTDIDLLDDLPRPQTDIDLGPDISGQ